MNEKAPHHITKRILEGEGPIQVWRERRCMPLATLAKRVGISPSALMELEIEGQAADAALLASIAVALRVPVTHLTMSQDKG
jgi:transcriptional regulator with XRE-family HTH domain